MGLGIKQGGGENLTAEVNAQTTVITNILESLVGKVQGANATADKILEGYSAYVGQKLLQGTAKEGIAISNFGYMKYAVDKFILASDTTAGDYKVTHSLGIIPKMAMLHSESFEPTSTSYINHMVIFDGSFDNVPTTEKLFASCGTQYDVTKGRAFASNSTGYYGGEDFTQNTVIFRRSEKLKAGVEYTLITMA